MIKIQLPLPSPSLEQRSQKLVAQISQKLKAKGGWLSFADFMQQALYTPGLGYYSGGLAKFGETGDFITAPELSALFGYCLAEQCAEILSAIGGSILEFGAGSGKLALDVLTQLARLDCLPENYFIIEPSAELQQRQQRLLQAKLPEFFSKIKWLGQLPESFSGVVLANEVLDAMPVHLVEFEQGEFFERGLSLAETGFTWQKRQLDLNSELRKRTVRLGEQYGLGLQPYQTEISLLIPAWLRSVSQMLTSGLVLLLDYGFPAHEYYHPQRNTGTLMCHYRHHAHPDPLFYPGLQDITAHVDFTLVAETACEVGLDVMGYRDQAGFLLNTRLGEHFNTHASDAKQQFTLAQQIKKLTLPHEMGELFKVMALGKNLDQELLGFRHGDQRQRL